MKDVERRTIYPSVSLLTTRRVIISLNAKFFVDSDWTQSALYLELIGGESDYNGLKDDVLRAYLDKNAQKCKESVHLDILEAVVKRELKMKMSDSRVTLHIKNVLVTYITTLPCIDLRWMLVSNPKIAEY